MPVVLATRVFRGSFYTMRGKYPKKLSKFVPAEISQALHQGLGKIYDIYPVWERIAGAEIARHSRPLAYSHNSLVIQVESPVWAAAIRQRQQRMLAEIQQVKGLQQTSEIRLKVSPTPIPVGPVESARGPARRISAAASDTIARTAEIIEEPSLKRALNRLYQHTSKPDNK